MHPLRSFLLCVCLCIVFIISIGFTVYVLLGFGVGLINPVTMTEVRSCFVEDTCAGLSGLERAVVHDRRECYLAPTRSSVLLGCVLAIALAGYLGDRNERHRKETRRAYIDAARPAVRNPIDTEFDVLHGCWPHERLDRLKSACDVRRALDWCDLRRLGPSFSNEDIDALDAWLSTDMRFFLRNEMDVARAIILMNREKKRDEMED